VRFTEFNILREDGSFKLVVPPSNNCPEVADLQKVLNAFGYDVGPPGIDGILGSYTKAAINRAQSEANITVGEVTPEFIALLNATLDEHPEIAGKLTKSTAREVKPIGASIDVSTIQDPDFNKKLEKVAKELGVKSNDLLAIMKQESGVNPKAVNSTSGATGLIQFMPSTAAELGTSTAALKNMSAVEQLDYVYRYFKMHGVKPGMDVGDLYLAVFYPAAVGKDDAHVISDAGKSVYNQNKGLDRNKDGTLTVADVKNSVTRFV
jgi:hypothetical protein